MHLFRHPRIRRGLGSRTLTSCGCLVGVYETYDGQTIGIVDARHERCVDGAHRPGRELEGVWRAPDLLESLPPLDSRPIRFA